MKKNSQPLLLLAFVLSIGISLGTVASVNAAGNSSKVNFCVNKATSVVTQKSKCSKSERVLSISKSGLPGPQGSPGPVGLPGVSGSSFSLSNYPSLMAEVDSINAAACQEKWQMIMTAFNIESDLLGQAIRNKPWATNLMGSCNYPMPEIFENPRIVSISNIVHGTKALSASNTDSVPRLYLANVTSMVVKVQLDNDWHLCTTADAQYSRRSLASRQTGWTQTAIDEITFTGSKNVGWSSAANGSDLADLQDEFNWPWFCGPDSRTASGVGYQTLNVFKIPLRFDDPDL